MAENDIVALVAYRNVLTDKKLLVGLTEQESAELAHANHLLDDLDAEFFASIIKELRELTVKVAVEKAMANNTGIQCWTPEAIKPTPYEAVLLDLGNGDFTTGWWSGSYWNGLAMNQVIPPYLLESGSVFRWCCINPQSATSQDTEELEDLSEQIDSTETEGVQNESR